MSKSPMILTLETAKARRQEVLDAALEKLIDLGRNENQARQVILPMIIDQGEKAFLKWVRGLEETDDLRRSAVAGFMSEDFVGWKIDSAMWDILHFDMTESMGVIQKNNFMNDIRATFCERFPQPPAYQTPWSSWAHVALAPAGNVSQLCLLHESFSNAGAAMKNLDGKMLRGQAIKAGPVAEPSNGASAELSKGPCIDSGNTTSFRQTRPTQPIDEGGDDDDSAASASGGSRVIIGITPTKAYTWTVKRKAIIFVDGDEWQMMPVNTT